jgi:hypothetical protein
MSSIRKFCKQRRRAADSGRISAHARELHGTKLTVLFVTHFMTGIMLS